ncbi:MAG: sigma-54-dependent Fis family transcriptional regulator [Methylobacterium sp.]|nr:sigma-54-dependent Fis family transcriptional regulator [Methylobacterium sp.]MCA3655169.1 sigma-54-dependent Fis family transcriptional regulator [Methylobacterium sp.]MCA3658776.1 sigma-54-dependent Fis family transcriptional regulator [Methylobacterium sp.]MCA3660391.1 sigma-54-dependent Fis family transcriptional regulator [Methylobacterium sp.]MCA3663877.1 sigma-54-dependent Fis family transcriptional regulator [Methylobacterium sp.]
MSATLLIVDDDPVQRRLLTEMVRRFGYQPEPVEGGAQALDRLNDRSKPKIDAMVLDLVMPELDGMTVLARLKAMEQAPPVIVQTAHGSIDAVISAMRAGATDFVVKPVGAERLQVSIKNALRVDALEGEVRRLSKRGSGALQFSDLASSSPDMTRAIRLGERAAKSGIPVLLEGESGVGKEVFARALQGASDRRGKPFVTVNCGAIPANLVESILFGHEKGAFTGATEKHLGKFVEASGGTLFLDEVSELPLDAQVKLLRAIQEGEVDPVGGRKTMKVDIRLVSASNRDLLDCVRQGRFREDLYYRLNVFPIAIPPLRNRREDIPTLVRRFIARFSAEEGRTIRGISAEAMQLLQSFHWPGNVRQLENAMFRAVILCEGDEITLDHMPQVAQVVSGYEVRIPTIAATPAPAPMAEREIVRVEIKDPSALTLLDPMGDVRPLGDVESETIRFALEHYRGQMSKVARKLGIGRSTLYRKLKELGIATEEPEGEDLDGDNRAA